ncbi:MAG: cob(I)yrinic acid a,c-diamide adenosyltransferase [Lachnospiraceae bacterium]|nr:cob(I)yrinic acid a,c-diamide adenosyltransferase [Lachnospiraceae bacterium]
MIHLYSGDGKGKTTAAIGLAIRALGSGKRVCFAQFLKGSRTSELSILENMPNLTILRNQKDYGFYANMADKERARVRKMHDDTLKQIQQMADGGQIDVLILDEITHVYRLGAINQKKVRSLLENRPGNLEIVLTGRDPDEFFVQIADYHTEMRKLRHPYDQGLTAREGIEF